ncbi:MAG: Na+/H+ antiporter subunit E [Pseudomonadota bacterium]
MLRLALIAVVLFGFWLVLSGHYQTWLVASGAGLSIAVVLFCWAKGITDREGFPIGLTGRGLVYWPWLIVQIVLSALRVTRLIISPQLPISPTLVKVDVEAQTSIGLVTYANSITLTPGTISIEASEKGRCIWVHAIEKDAADGFQDDPMNRKVAWFERARA